MAISNVDSWTRFLERYYRNDIHTLAHEYPDQLSLYIEFVDVEKYDSGLAEELLQNPVETLATLEDALQNFDLPLNKRLDGAHARLRHVPDPIAIRAIRGAHIEKLITIEGLVQIVADVRPVLQIAAFECPGCGEIMYVKQEHDRFSEPYKCSNDGCSRKGPFKLLLDNSKLIDAHKLRVQESPDSLRGGKMAQTLDVILKNDIAGIVSPGNHVTIVGILRSYQRITRAGKSPILDLVLDVNSIDIHDREFTEIEITPEEKEEIVALSQDPDIYSKIVRSIAPSVYGYNNVKEGLALQSMSGGQKNNPDGSRTRGDIHVLLVGDPGVAKSELLRYMSRLSPRGILVVGYSSSGVGLTAAAVRSEFGDGRWALEAGALVLADRGLIAVDELDKMRPEDRQALHEAAEQQTVTISKAGIQTTLQARCTILAAANPKYSRFDPYEGLASQIAMPPTLLSRFDLIYVIKDEPEPERDRAIFRHIVGSKSQSQEPEISPELLRKYIAYAKSGVQPATIDRDAQEILENFYLGLRDRGNQDVPIPTTARQIQALVRLSEASARMRLSAEVTAEDAKRAIRVTEAYMKQVVYDEETNMFDIDRIEGVSKSQRDTIKLFREIIRKIEGENGGAAPKTEISTEAVAQGISPERIEGLFGELLRNGDLLMDKCGYRVI